MAVSEILSDEECYLLAILDDQSGLDLSEFSWYEPDKKDGCFRAWPFQWSWWRNTSPLQIDQCARSIGKTLGIQARAFVFPFKFPGQEMVVTAPELVHLEPITGLIERRFYETRLGREIMPHGRSAVTHRPFQMNFLTGSRVIGRIPQLTGKGVKGCLAEGTPVLTIDGYKPVEELQPGDALLTHEGRWKQVMKVVEDENDCFEVRGQSSFPLTVSCDHRFYGAENSAGPKAKRAFLPLAWHDVETLIDHKVYWASPVTFPLLPIPDLEFKGTALRFDTTTASMFWWAVGRWLADGYLAMNKRTSKERMVKWVVHHDKSDQLKAALTDIGASVHIEHRAHSSADVLHVSSAAWYRWLKEHFGQLADGKRLPAFVLGMPRPFRQALLNGYLAGDGHYSQERGRWETGSASKMLSVGVQMLAQSLGYTVNCSVVQPKPNAACAAPKLSWRLQLFYGHPVRLGQHSVAKVKSVVPVGKRKVYNPIVEDDHSYVSGAIVSHNVHPVSLELDEAQDYPDDGWTELIETLKRGTEGATWHAHGVTRGMRDKFYEFTQDTPDNHWKIHRITAMHRPNWSDEERQEKIRLYGSREAPDYRRNVLGQHGDQTNPLFVLHRLMRCWSADTLVNTPQGTLRIDEIKAGHIVFNAIGVGEVRRVTTSEHSRVAFVWLTSGERLVCSPDHRLFTEDGWVEAQDAVGRRLIDHDEAMRAVWEPSASPEQAVLREGLHGEVAWSDVPWVADKNAHNGYLRMVRDRVLSALEGRPVLWGPLRCEMEGSPTEKARCSNVRDLRGDIRPSESDKPVLFRELSGSVGQLGPYTREPDTVGQVWAGSGRTGRADQGRVRPLDRAGSHPGRMVSAVLDESARHTARSRRVSLRSCLPDTEGDYRGRWTEPQGRWQNQGSGPGQGGVGSSVRVDRVEIHERGDSEFTLLSGGADHVLLYDLTVGGHPSFAVGAGAFVVHNCVDSVEASVYNEEEYQLYSIKAEILDEMAGEVQEHQALSMIQLLDFPEAHRKYKSFWVGMDVGFTTDPSEILVFAEYTPSAAELKLDEANHRAVPEKGQTRLKLVSRVNLQRISHPLQVRAMQWVIDFYKPKAFGMDKMQPVSEPVLTPGGWRTMGDLRLGDYVIGSDGKPTEVMGVYPQTDRRVMKVTFNDGSWTRCGPEHLWRVENTQNEAAWPVLTTEQLALAVDGQRQRIWTVPLLSAPVDYGTNGGELPIDPYTFGLLLGDGNLRGASVRFSTAEAELLLALEDGLPAGVVVKHAGRYDYEIASTEGYARGDDGRFVEGRNPLVSALRAEGLLGSRSHEKFIPEKYLRATPSERLALLQGIMDTDGWVTVVPNGRSCVVAIRSSSWHLIHGVTDLVEGLGGSVRYSTHATSCNGRPGRLAHKLVIALPAGVSPFRLSRKRDAVVGRKLGVRRFIDRIEPDGEERSVCIRVAAEDHLYVTRHHLLTHNTGNGLPLFQDLQSRSLENAKVVKGYNFSEKVIVDIDGTVAVGERDDLLKEAAIKSNVLEFSTDKLRELVDHARLQLPWDRDVIREFQGQTWSYSRALMDAYGRRRRTFSAGSFHALDAARMAAMAHTQHKIEAFIEDHKNQSAEPVLDYFVMV